jgi:hypothetical protein
VRKKIPAAFFSRRKSVGIISLGGGYKENAISLEDQNTGKYQRRQPAALTQGDDARL